MILIYRSTYEEMLSALLDLSPERGGILGAKQGRPISKFYFDKSGVSTPDSYTPNYNKINAVLEQWETENIYMVGIVHSHHEDNILPSCGDLFYCERILRFQRSNGTALGHYFFPHDLGCYYDSCVYLRSISWW